MDYEEYSELDREYMKYALSEAKIAFDKDEVPIGAIIVFENTILAKAHNLIESLKDATAHAEILCIKEAAKKIGDWRLVNTTLYVTVEPCCMCAGALILSRVKKVVWGCPDPRHGASGSFADLFAKKHPIHQVMSKGGLYAEEAKELMQTFFQNKRGEKDGVRRVKKTCSGDDRGAEAKTFDPCQNACTTHH